MYTEADVARLRLLNGAVEQGHSIGRLAGLDRCELRHLAATAGAIAPSAAVPTRRTPLDTTALITALRKYDATAIDQEISRLAAVLRPLDLLQDVLMPVLAQVGDDWHRGRTRIAHEHLMSSTMRNILGAFLRLVRAPETCRSACCLRRLPASATRSRRSARRCSRPAAGWASPISAPICRRAKSSTASSPQAPRCWCSA